MITVKEKVVALASGVSSVDYSEWEEGFITSVNEQMETRGEGSLSEKQQKFIHDLYDKHEDNL